MKQLAAKQGANAWFQDIFVKFHYMWQKVTPPVSDDWLLHARIRTFMRTKRFMYGLMPRTLRISCMPRKPPVSKLL